MMGRPPPPPLEAKLFRIFFEVSDLDESPELGEDNDGSLGL